MASKAYKYLYRQQKLTTAVTALKRTSGITADYILASLTLVDAAVASRQAEAKGLVYVGATLIEVKRNSNLQGTGSLESAEKCAACLWR